jgi:hypothetical protein
MERWSEQIPDSLDLKEFLAKSNIQALDRGIKLFSDALLVAYNNYGELTQLWGYRNLVADHKFTEQNCMIY